MTLASLETDLRLFFDSCEESCFLIHTDILNLGVWEGMPVRRKDLLQCYYDLMLRVSEGRQLFFPTFNYDYARTRLYDVRNDPCQVGVLNEFVRKKAPGLRTQTPIFNFAALTEPALPLAPASNPFGSDSFWRHFCDKNGRIAFLGLASLANSTFGHYVEEIYGIGYRYLKSMPGHILLDGRKSPVDFVFRVRPYLPDGRNVVDYEENDRVWLESRIKAGMVTRCSIGEGCLLSYNARQWRDYCLNRFEEDELWTLSSESRMAVLKLKNTKPWPFRFEDFEAEAG